MQSLDIRMGDRSRQCQSGMPQHHLDALEHALLQKGWKFIPPSPDVIPSDFNAWYVERGAVSLTIFFEHFGHLGELLPFSESWACDVYSQNRRERLALLYFWKSPRFERELHAFMKKLDDVG